MMLLHPSNKSSGPWTEIKVLVPCPQWFGAIPTIYGEVAFNFSVPENWNKRPEDRRLVPTLTASNLRWKAFVFSTAHDLMCHTASSVYFECIMLSTWAVLVVSDTFISWIRLEVPQLTSSKLMQNNVDKSIRGNSDFLELGEGRTEMCW